MKKNIYITIALLFIAIVPAMSLDFGGIISNTTKIGIRSDGTLPLTQQDSLTGWVKKNFNSVGNHYFAAEGFFQYEYTNPNLKVKTEGKHHPVIDITLLKYNYAFLIDSVRSISFSFGRFGFSDMTGLIFNQTSDGFLVDYRKPRFHSSFYMGYTGLLNSHNVSMVDPNFSKMKDDWYDLATKFVVAEGSVTFPNLFANQMLGVEYLALIAAGATNQDQSKYMITVAMNGPITSKLFWAASTTFGNKLRSQLTNLSQISLAFYPGVKAIGITLNAVSATGEDGPFKTFYNLTKSTAIYSTEDIQYSDMTKVGLSFSIKPVNVLQLGVSSDVIFTNVYNMHYKGVQWAANINIQPLGDLTVGLSAKQFIGKDPTTNKLDFALRASLAL